MMALGGEVNRYWQIACNSGNEEMYDSNHMPIGRSPIVDFQNGMV